MATRLMRGFASLSGIILLVGSSPPADAQVAGDSARNTSGAVPVVRGRLVAGDTGAPVTDARIVARSADRPRSTKPEPMMQSWPDGPSASVDAAGRFEFSNLPPGRYRLIAEPGPAAARYLTAEYPDSASEPPLVVDDRPIDGIAIPLPRAAAITGRVVNERGESLTGVSVTAVGVLPGNRIRRHIGLPPIARTDDNGHFRIFGLSPGEYVLQGTLALLTTMVMPGGMRATVGPSEYQPTYSPGTLSLAEAARIRVQAGDEVGPIEFALSRRQALTVRGTVVDSTGQPLGGVPVRVVPIRPGVNMTLRAGQSSRADGSFAVTDVLPGENILSAFRWDGSGQEYGSVPLTIAGDVDGLVVQLRRGVTIRGRIVFEGPAPAAFESLNVRAVPLLATPERGATVVQPSADGSFAIDNQVGPLLLRTIGLTGWTLKTVSHGGRDITDVPTEFTSGGASVEVLLSRNTATLTGSVRTARGAGTDAAVLIFGADPSQWDARFTTTRLGHSDGQGRYRLDGLRAGRYLAIALRVGDVSLDDSLPIYFDLLAGLATPVVVDEGGSVPLDLERMTLASAERERERLHAGIEELDLEPSIGDRFRLPDQLIQTLLGDGADAVTVDVPTLGKARRLAVDRHPKTDPALPSWRSHHEMKITRVKATGDPAAGAVREY